MKQCNFVTQSGYVYTETVPLPVHSEQDDAFHYELVHLRYLEACENYFKMRHSITGPWTVKAKKHIIDSIKAKKHLYMLSEEVYKLESDLLQKYQIALEDGIEKLVVTDTSIEALPYEECFDIFVEVHNKTEHGGFDVVQKSLENVFLINDMCLKFFLAHCNLCKKSILQKMKPVRFNDCVNVEILKAPVQDTECRYVLFYIDKATTFMLLRPLIAMDDYEIAIEMLKIFTDFGPPLVIKTIYTPLLNSVLTVLERAGFSYDISIQASDQVISKSYNLMEQIVKRTNHDSTYWSTNCRLIQCKHNNGLLSSHDPVLNRSLNSTIKPFTQLFFTKHSANNDSNPVRSAQNTKASNVGNIIEERFIDLETSETETASEPEEYHTIRAMEVEEKFYLRTQQQPSTSRSTPNIPTNTDVDLNDQLLQDSIIDNMDITNNSDIKIEDNPIETVSPQNSYEWYQNTFVRSANMPKIVAVHTAAGETGPLIIDPVLQKYLIPKDSVTATKVLPVTNLESIAGTSIETDYCVGIPEITTRKRNVNAKKEDKYCSACNGKMLTDYFCFGCKKKTHIFCLNRGTTPLKKDTDAVISYTYCELCLKSMQKT